MKPQPITFELIAQTLLIFGIIAILYGVFVYSEKRQKERKKW